MSDLVYWPCEKGTLLQTTGSYHPLLSILAYRTKIGAKGRNLTVRTARERTALTLSYQGKVVGFWF